jgi:rubrerythrin
MTKFQSIEKSVKDLGERLTPDELIRAIRLNIAAEHEAILQYEQLINSTDNEIVKKIAQDVRADELRHVGNWEYALQLLSEDDRNGIAQGAAEAEKLVGENE